MCEKLWCSLKLRQSVGEICVICMWRLMPDHFFCINAYLFFPLQWIFWPMWHGNWVVSHVIESLALVPTWTLPVSATSWQRSSTSTLPAVTAGSLESTVTPVVCSFLKSFNTLKLQPVNVFFWENSLCMCNLYLRFTHFSLLFVCFVVPVWSGVNVAGVCLQGLNPKMGAEDDSENWKEVHKMVVDGWVQYISLNSNNIFKRTSWTHNFCLPLSLISHCAVSKSLLCSHALSRMYLVTFGQRGNALLSLKTQSLHFLNTCKASINRGGKPWKHNTIK